MNLSELKNIKPEEILDMAIRFEGEITILENEVIRLEDENDLLRTWYGRKSAELEKYRARFADTMCGECMLYGIRCDCVQPAPEKEGE